VWLEGQRRLLAELGGRYAEIAGADVATAILDFAHAENAAQLVLGATRRTRGYQALHGSVIGRIISRADQIEVHFIAALQPPKHPLTARWRLPPRQRRVELPPRRRLAGWLLAGLAPVAITVALIPFRSSLGLAGALLCVLLAVFASALAGGIRPAVAATVVGFLAADFFFAAPYYSLRIDQAIDVVGLIVFAIVAAATGLLVDVLARRGIQSAHSQAEAAALPAWPPEPWHWDLAPGRRWPAPCGAPSTWTPWPYSGAPAQAGRRWRQRADRCPPRPARPRSRPSSPAGTSWSWPTAGSPSRTRDCSGSSSPNCGSARNGDNSATSAATPAARTPTARTSPRRSRDMTARARVARKDPPRHRRGPACPACGRHCGSPLAPACSSVMTPEPPVIRVRRRAALPASRGAQHGRGAQPGRRAGCRPGRIPRPPRTG
jgi:hypothetical protein